jgi:hypothetical protein
MRVGDLVRYTCKDSNIQYGSVGIVVRIHSESVDIVLKDGWEWNSSEEFWEVL